MSILAQGTQLYVMDPADDSVIVVSGVTTFNPGGAPSDQIETTDLDDTTRTFVSGLRSPGQATMSLNADPANAAHIRLHELSQTDPNPVLKWVFGWSDGTAAPTVTAGAWTLPTTRTWFAFEGYVADFPFDFQGNAVVSTQLSIQRSGKGVWTKKAAV